MLDISKVIIFIKSNPILMLSLLVAVVLLAKNYRKLAIKCSKLLSVSLTITVNIVLVAVMVFALVATALIYSSFRVLYQASYFNEFFNLHILPCIFFSICKYQTYIIPKFIFTLKRPILFREGLMEIDNDCYEYAIDEQDSPFVMPAPVLLQ